MSVEPHIDGTAHGRVLLFAHLGKSGGSTFNAWATAAVQRGDLSYFVPYTTARCWLYTLFASSVGVVVPNGSPPPGCPSWTELYCHRVVRKATQRICKLPKWSASRVVVEFHAASLVQFFARVLRYRVTLRAACVSSGVSCRTAILVREPIALLFSVYRAWPPFYCTGTSADRSGCLDSQLRPSRSASSAGANLRLAFELGALVPFPVWMEDRHDGATAGYMVPLPFSNTSLHTTDPFVNPHGCAAVLRQARRALATIDIVGATNCMQPVLEAVASHLLLQGSSLLEHVPVVRPPYGSGYGPALAAQIHDAWTWDRLNSSTRRRMREITECDGHLYRDVLALSRRARDSSSQKTCALPGPLATLPDSVSGHRVLSERAYARQVVS